MFTKEELEPGAKRVVLEYIANNGIPIAKIFSEKEAEYARRQGLELIIRADNACQWDGFSGIFRSYNSETSKIDFFWTMSLSIQQLIAVVRLDETLKVKGKPGLEISLLNEIKKIKGCIEWYCKGLSIEKPPYDLKALIQESHLSSNQLFQHPHNPDLVVIGGGSYTVLYNRKENSFDYILNLRKIGIEGKEISSIEFEPLLEVERHFRKAIEYYDKIAGLPKFSKEWVFEIEFGRHKKTGQTLIYQVKKFRKKETPIDVALPEPSEDVLDFYLTFGITEGIILRCSYPLGSSSNDNFSQNICFAYPGGGWEGAYCHVSLPNIKCVFYPGFQYSQFHGGRETLMKVPLVLCYSPGMYEDLASNVRLIDGSKLGKLQDVFSNGRELKVYSDGIKGRIEVL